MLLRLAIVLVVFLVGSVHAQTPPGKDAKVHEVGKDGLVIDGKLTKDDAPLVNAPVAELKGAPHQVFRVTLHKGKHYVIDLVSKDFDAFLILEDAAGKRLAYDDDSGGGLNSRIDGVVNAEGTYRLVAAALDRKPGVFQMKIRVGELSEEEKLAAEALKLDRDGFQLHQQGQPAAALVKWRQALEIRQKLFPASQYPDGHPNLAASLNNLGLVLRTMGQPERALPYYQQSLAMYGKLFPESKYPDGHLGLAVSLNNLALVLRAMGQMEQALPYIEQSLAMRRKLFPESKYPDGHPDLAAGLNNLGFVLNAVGQPEKALPHFEQSLGMRRKLFPESKFPDGHPDLASSLNNQGDVLRAMGQMEQALPYIEQSLAMRRKLFPEAKYPDGHPDLARSLNNLGFVLNALGQAEKALPYCEQSLAMSRKLSPESKYPDGHPELATSLNNLGFVLEAMGQPEQALPFCEQSLAMRRKQFPESKYRDGHPDLASSLINLGSVLNAIGQPDKALCYCGQALAMQRSLGRRLIATASEAEALAFVQHQPMFRDALLSLTLHLPNTATGAYDSVWGTKSAITRVLAQRHAAARIAGTEHAAHLDDLKGLRRRIDQLLQDRGLRPADREQLLAKATDERDQLERLLAKALPMRQRAQLLDTLGPRALIDLLPDHAVLIDFVRYTRFAYDRNTPGKTRETRVPSYAAFVVGRSPVADAPGSPAVIKRIELGAAEAIDGAVAYWRDAIESRPAATAAKQLRELVWAKLAPHLPAGTKTLYIAPDGDLARVPWAALPVGKDRVLLEDYVVATVPHGPFLLEHLKYPQQFSGVESLLTVGDVDYTPLPNSKKGQERWPPLPGTKIEIAALAPLAPSKRENLCRSDATPDRLTQALPKARFAHLATHGEFQAKEFAAEQKRAEKAQQTRRFGDELQRVAAKNPLGYVGLVLSEGQTISGLSILDLNLENLQLVTLSACETSLGEYTGGKGVENLQLAFHIAGCPNVVASLWKVNDAATAALMTKFYHEMWVNKKPPIEALRQAQLTIYRHPELIPALAGERGRPELDKAVTVRSGEPSGVSRRVADTRLWAAFVLSGVGK